MHRAVQDRCLRKVLSPDLFALRYKAIAPNSNAPPNGVASANPELTEVKKAPTAPPIVTNQKRYLSLLHRRVSLNNGSDRRAIRTVKSIQRKISVNPAEMIRAPRIFA